MVLGVINNISNWAEDQAQKVGVGDGGEWEDIPVEDDVDPAPAPAPAPAAAPPADAAPSPAPDPAAASASAAGQAPLQPPYEDYGVVYRELPDGTDYGVYQGEPADWQKVGPSPEQLEQAEQTGEPISGNAPRTQEAADQLNSVRPEDAPQEVAVVDSGDPALPNVETQPAEDNPFLRYTPFDEIAESVGAESGILGKARGVLTGLGQFANQQKERNVESIGDRALNAIANTPDADLNRRFEAESSPITTPLQPIVSGAEAGLAGYRALRKTGNPLDAIGAAASTLMTDVVTEPLTRAIDVTFEEFLYDPANRDELRRIADEGYRGLTGGKAAWQYYQDQTTSDGFGGALKRGLRDVAYDPTVVETAMLGAAVAAGGKIGAAGRAGQIAVDPLGEAIGAVPKAVGKIPGAPAAVDRLANSAINPFRLTDDAQSRIKLDSAVTQSEALGRQLDETGRRGPAIADAPSIVGKDRATGQIWVEDVATGRRRAFDVSNPMAEFESIDRVLGELDYKTYRSIVNSPRTRNGGINWYDLLYNGDRYGLPKFYDNALTSNPVEHERYINLFIRRIDANAAADPVDGAQNVITGMWRDVKEHAFGGKLSRYPDSMVDPHLAAYKADTIQRVLDKGGFVDARAAQHARLKSSIRRKTFSTLPRTGTPFYRPAAAPFVYRTPRPTAPTLRGPVTDDLIFTPEDLAVLQQDVDGRRLEQVVAEVKQTLNTARQLSQKQVAGSATPEELRQLAAIAKPFGDARYRLIETPERFATLTPEDINVAAARAARFELEIKLGVRDAKGKVIDNRTWLGKKWDDGTGFVKSMMLLNNVAVLPFTAKQIIGNFNTLGIANKRAAGDYLASSGNARRIADREAKGVFSDSLSDVDRMRSGAGLGNTGRVRQSSRTGTLRSIDEMDKPSKLGNLLSAEKLRIWSQVSDLVMRESLYKTTFMPGWEQLNQTIRGHALDRSTGFGVSVTEDQIDNAITALERSGMLGNKSPVYSAMKLRQSLEASGAIGAPDDVKRWADRVARDYLGATPGDPATGFKGLRAIDNDALKEVDRVGFSFNETKIDAVLNRITFYHYWNSRAGGLYARELMRQPALAAAYYRMAESLEREADDKQYPEYLRGFARFMNSPMGYAAYLDPATTFGTFMTFGEGMFASGDPDMRRLTDLGKAWDKSPFLPHPWLTTMLYWSGMLGDISAPDPTGLQQIFRQSGNLVNLWRASNGESPLPIASGIPNATNLAANKISSWMVANGLDGGLSLPVERMNPNRAWENNKNWFVQARLRELHGEEWTDQQIADAAANIQDDPENEITRWAMKEAAKAPYQQPSFGLDGKAGGAVQGVMNFLRPVGVQARPAVKDENVSIRYQLRTNKGAMEGKYIDPRTRTLQSPNEAEKQGIYGLNDAAAAASEQVYGFQRRVDGYFDLGTLEQKRAQDTYKSIVSGQYREPIVAGDLTVYPEELAAMDDEQRKQLAQVYLNETGEWPALQGLWTAREQYRQSNPDLNDYLAYWDEVNDFPGGPDAWAAQKMQADPAFARFVETQERLDPASAEPGDARNKMLTDRKAYLAATSQRRTLYENPNLRPPGDYGPYIPGVPVGMTPSQAQNLGGGDGEGEGASSGSSFMDDKKDTLQNELGNFYGMVGIMNAWDAQMGYTPGTSVQRYVDRVRTGDKKLTIDDGLYDQIKASYDYVFPSKNDLKGFLTWAFDPSLNPDGQLNIDAYLEYDSIEYARQQLLKPVGGKAPSNIGELTSGLTTVRGADGSGPSGTTQPAVYTPTIATPMLADPTNPYSQLTQLGPGLPLTVLRRQGSMALVQAPNGAQGWIPVGNLKRAA